MAVAAFQKRFSLYISMTWVADRPVLWRWILAGPVSLILAILSMAVLPLLLPGGAAGVNNLVFPVLLFPLLWAGYCVWAVATDALNRCARIMVGLFVGQLVVLVLSFLL